MHLRTVSRLSLTLETFLETLYSPCPSKQHWFMIFLPPLLGILSRPWLLYFSLIVGIPWGPTLSPPLFLLCMLSLNNLTHPQLPNTDNDTQTPLPELPTPRPSAFSIWIFHRHCCILKLSLSLSPGLLPHWYSLFCSDDAMSWVVSP